MGLPLKLSQINLDKNTTVLNVPKACIYSQVKILYWTQTQSASRPKVQGNGGKRRAWQNIQQSYKHQTHKDTYINITLNIKKQMDLAKINSKD